MRSSNTAETAEGRMGLTNFTGESMTCSRVDGAVESWRSDLGKTHPIDIGRTSSCQYGHLPNYDGRKHLSSLRIHHVSSRNRKRQ